MRKNGSFQSGAKYGIYRYEQPPLAKQGIVLKGKGLVVANALTSRRLGLTPLQDCPLSTGKRLTLSGKQYGNWKMPDIYSVQGNVMRKDAYAVQRMLSMSSRLSWIYLHWKIQHWIIQHWKSLCWKNLRWKNPTQLNKELLKTNLPTKEKLNTDISSTHSIPFHSLNPSPLEDAAQPPERKRKETKNTENDNPFRKINNS